MIAMDNVSTKKTNTTATNVTNTASINCNNEKVRGCYICTQIYQQSYW